eukprot:ANDGO_02428.mRNA.1 hypothetical protein H310_11653
MSRHPSTVHVFVDSLLGPLARKLRMHGIDADWVPDSLFDAELMLERLVSDPERILMTNRKTILRNRDFLERVGAHRMLYVQNTDLNAVFKMLDVYTDEACFFTRCAECNGVLQKVDSKESVRDRIHISTFEKFDLFFECSECQKVFWQGSTYDLAKLACVKTGISS